MKLNDIHCLAAELFPKIKDPIPRYLIARDVLAQEISHTELAALKAKVFNNKSIHILQTEQWQDGSWGRIHTQDTKRRQKVATTEVGVRRALALGLDSSDEILSNALEYLLQVLRDQIDYRDTKEKHPFFNTALHLICADCIGQISPNHPALNPFKRQAVTILTRAFESGKYSIKAETYARLELKQMPQVGKPQDWTQWLNSRYDFSLLSTCDIPQDLRNRYMIHQWESKNGLRYIGAPLRLPAEGTPARGYHRWMDGLEVFCRMPGSTVFLEPVAEWLWQHKDKNGLWNFGKPLDRGANYDSFPYADSWRGNHQSLDWSVRVLRLLNKMIKSV